jgi:hypothetical protein
MKKIIKQLSKRDLEVAKWVAEQGAVRLATINRLLASKGAGLEPRVLRALAQRLVLHGLIQKERILAGSAIVWPTAQGLELAGLKLKPGERAARPSLSNLLHSIQVAEVRVIYEREGASWVCERMLRREYINHLPDGIAIYEDQKILVEIDRTRKENDRLLTIMMENLSDPSIVVDYWTTQELFKHINKQRESLPKILRNRLRIFVIPNEVL